MHNCLFFQKWQETCGRVLHSMFKVWTIGRDPLWELEEQWFSNITSALVWYESLYLLIDLFHTQMCFIALRCVSVLVDLREVSCWHAFYEDTWSKCTGIICKDKAAFILTLGWGKRVVLAYLCTLFDHVLHPPHPSLPLIPLFFLRCERQTGIPLITVTSF